MSVLQGSDVREAFRFMPSSTPEEVRATYAVTPARYFRWKNAVDRAVAALLLVPGLPIIGLLVLLVRLTSRGPGLYRQLRVGKDGRLFHMYKIRTMGCDAEASTGPVWTTRNDPRVTRVGRVLRKLHLDEFPQLLNVVKGEMALVGPRPERPEFVRVLGRQIPAYMNRLAVRPGITGLAQINLPPDSDVTSVHRKVILDLEYIERAGLFIDARMFLCTFVRLLGIPGELVMRMFALRRVVPQIDGSPLAARDDASPEPSAANATPDSIVARPGKPAASGDGNGQPEDAAGSGRSEGAARSGQPDDAPGNGQPRRHGQARPKPR
jgi:lipopolysaccharide/colanic/teichoic acid biosynthesis glycosyltransferase